MLDKARKAFEALGFKKFEDFGSDGTRAKSQKIDLILTAGYGDSICVFTEWERAYDTIGVGKAFNIYRVSEKGLLAAVDRVHAFWKKNGIDLKPKKEKNVR